METHREHPELALRIAALADPVDDSDWLEVRRRARALTRRAAPSAKRVRPLRVLAVAASLALVLAAAGPALGVDTPLGAVEQRLGSLFGGEPEENFSTHEGRELPLYLQVGRTEDGGDSGLVRGRVFAPEIVSLEVRSPDGRVVELSLDAKREFSYTIEGDATAELIARDAAGKVVARLPLLHPAGSHGG